MVSSLGFSCPFYLHYLSKKQIQKGIKNLAQILDEKLQDKEVVMIPVMKGAICFTADLMREMQTDVVLEPIKCSSYGMKGTQRGELKIFDMDHIDVKDKHVLIVDDLIDSGRTLCKAAELLKEKGVKKLFCYGTHGILTLGTQNLCECFERVMTSNTHYQEDNHVEIIDVSPVFAEAIYRAQVGESISSLFKLENNNN